MKRYGWLKIENKEKMILCLSTKKEINRQRIICTVMLLLLLIHMDRQHGFLLSEEYYTFVWEYKLSCLPGMNLPKNGTKKLQLYCSLIEGSKVLCSLPPPSQWAVIVSPTSPTMSRLVSDILILIPTDDPTVPNHAVYQAGFPNKFFRLEDWMWGITRERTYLAIQWVIAAFELFP